MTYEQYEVAIERLGLRIEWGDTFLKVWSDNDHIATVWSDKIGEVLIKNKINKLHPKDVSSVRTLTIGLAGTNPKKR